MIGLKNFFSNLCDHNWEYYDYEHINLFLGLFRRCKKCKIAQKQ